MPKAVAIPEPVVLVPILVERIWGAASLDPWHPGSKNDLPVGEIWLTAENCVAESGAAEGKTLADLTAATPEAFGDPRREGFPLLVKLLFPREKLSVQVHPDDAQARALGMPRGKTECWYILDAQPGRGAPARLPRATDTRPDPRRHRGRHHRRQAPLRTREDRGHGLRRCWDGPRHRAREWLCWKRSSTATRPTGCGTTDVRANCTSKPALPQPAPIPGRAS